jgi:hypothetical protein
MRSKDSVADPEPRERELGGLREDGGPPQVCYRVGCLSGAAASS